MNKRSNKKKKAHIGDYKSTESQKSLGTGKNHKKKKKGKDLRPEQEKKIAKEDERKRLEKSVIKHEYDIWILSIASLLYFELYFKFITVRSSGLQDWVLTFAYTVAIGLIASSIISFFKEHKFKTALIIVELFYFILYTGQFVHYRFYTSFFSLFSLISGTGQIVQFKKAILRVITENIVQIILLSVPLGVSIIFVRKRKVISSSWKRSLVAFLLAVMLLLSLPNTLNKNDDRIYSPHNIYNNVNSPFYSVRYFGLAETMVRDTWRYLTGFRDTAAVVIPKDVNAASMDLDKEYNICETDFLSLAESEERLTVADMHRYFASVKPTEKNNYTGIFKGKNLIFVVAESLCYGGINKELTPTLYKLASEGINFSNCYTPIYYASTYDGEFMTLLSLLPKDGEWSLYATRNNSLPYSFGNAFGKLGYRTEAYHGWKYDYYYRDESHPNLGYKWNAIGNGLDVESAWWPPSDVEVVEKSVYQYVSDSPFMVYYLTISGHLEYTFNDNMIALKNKDRVQELDYSVPVKAYFACQKELDDSLALLLSDLEEQGILDDTVIVLTNDHYPYGLMEDELEEFCDYIENEKFDIHKGVFIVYNSATEGKQIDTVCSNIDILPTVSNMFGLEFDSRLMMGTDVMSGGEPVAVFSDRSWITSSGIYDASTQNFRKARMADIGPEYVDEMNQKVYDKFLMSKLILDYDYYSLVS